MKKVLTILLSVCLLASMVATFAVGASAAEDIEVTVGQKFEWNDQSGDAESMKAWLRSKGTSPDGLWKYQVYVLAKDIYLNTVISSNFFAWNATPGNTGLGYARARNHGKNFHPGEAADIVKVFTFPSGGTVTVDSTVARQNEWVTGTGTPSSFAVYLDDKLVYPTSGEYETLTSTTPRDISFDIDVAKNQRLYIHIGCVDGDQGSDAVDMSNTITYKAVNDTSVELGSDATFTLTGITNTVDVTLNPGDVPTDDNSSRTSGKLPPIGGNDDSSSTGLIIGVVAAVVVVAAVAVVIVVKKKKQD